MTDWSGNLYRQIRYAAYGEVRGRYNAAGNPAFAEDARFEFTGYETDFAGLDYAGARFFDPELAQFGSHDPAGQYPSPYAYGPGDPVNGADPSGQVFLEIYIAAIVIRAVVAFIDAKSQTGSTRAGISAAGHGAADAATFGVYSSVKAISNDQFGQYMANYYANRLTLGVYGAVQAFNNEQIAAGVVGAVSSAVAIVGIANAIYNIYSAPFISGDLSKHTMSWSWDGSTAETVFRWTVFDYKEPLGGSYALELLTIIPIAKPLKAGKAAVRIGSHLDDLVRAAQKAYPKQAGRIELHHVKPKYLGGDPKGPTTALDAAYHQEITNAFRAEWDYGTGSIPSAEQLQAIMQRVYERFPLP